MEMYRAKEKEIVSMELLYMFPFLRSLLIVCALLCSFVSVLLIIQLVLFREISKQSMIDFGRLATAHTTVGGLLAIVTILFSLALWALAYWIAEPIPVRSSSSTRDFGDFTPENISIPPEAGVIPRSTMRSPYPAGRSWGRGRHVPGKLKVVPEGDGIIEGQVLLDGKGAAGVGLELILNKEYRSPPLKTDASGFYRMKVKKGEYSYNGWSLDMGAYTSPLDGKVHIDNDNGGYFSRNFDPNKIDRELDEELEKSIKEIRQKSSPQEAQEQIEKLFQKKYPQIFQNRRHVLIAGDEPATVPPLCFVTPVPIVFPPEKTNVPREKLKFEWGPIEGAAYYAVEIHFEERLRGGRTSYDVLTRIEDIVETSLPGKKILERIDIVQNRRYLVEVHAFDVSGKKISQSYPHHSFGIK